MSESPNHDQEVRIPDGAVEAAAKRRIEDATEPGFWETLEPYRKAEELREARDDLVAALPRIREAVLEEERERWGRYFGGERWLIQRCPHCGETRIGDYELSFIHKPDCAAPTVEDVVVVREWEVPRAVQVALAHQTHRNASQAAQQERERMLKLAEEFEDEAAAIEAERKRQAEAAPGTTQGFAERARAETRQHCASRIRVALSTSQPEEGERRQKADGPVYFFGCLHGVYGHGQVGHYFYEEPPAHERQAPRKGPRLGDGVLPEQIRDGGKIDGPYCPHYAREVLYAKAKLTHRAGWTVLGFWDSSGDTRPASDSNFFMRGTLRFEDALAEARRAFPAVIERAEKKYGPIELVQTDSDPDCCSTSQVGEGGEDSRLADARSVLAEIAENTDDPSAQAEAEAALTRIAATTEEGSG